MNYTTIIPSLYHHSSVLLSKPLVVSYHCCQHQDIDSQAHLNPWEAANMWRLDADRKSGRYGGWASEIPQLSHYKLGFQPSFWWCRISQPSTVLLSLLFSLLSCSGSAYNLQNPLSPRMAQRTLYQ
jgi:hypothetical protein